MFHKVTSVLPMPNFELGVHFWDGTTKIYDVKPLFEKWSAFKALRGEDGDFYAVKVDEGGYGISWNDDLDLSCDELWENGVSVKTVFDNILSLADASKIWELDESTLRKAIARGKLLQGVDACKYGKQWVVSYDAMVREYGAL